jgi:hypothetical protein
MKNLKFLVLILFCTTFSYAETVLIKNINIVDVEQEKILSNMDILITDETIVDIRPSQENSAPQSSTKIINGNGFYITPGLVDAHIHADLYYWEKKADDWSLPLYVANGVTTVRDAGGSSLTLEMRNQIASKKRVGPRMVISSPFITSDPKAAGENVELVTTADEAVAKVKGFLARGFDGVKIESKLNLESYNAAGAYLNANNSFLFGHSLAVKNNGYWETPFEDITNFYRSIEHLGFLGPVIQNESSPYYHNSTASPNRISWMSSAYMDFDKAQVMIETLKRKNQIVSPTLITVDYQLKLDTDGEAFINAGIDAFRTHPLSQYYPDYYFDIWVNQYKTWGFGLGTANRKDVELGFANQLKLVKMMDDAGLSIIAGTDTPARPYILAGFSLHDELAIYSSAGLSPWRTLRTATLNAAKALGKSGKIGSLTKGAFADFIMTKNNPIQDLSVLRHPDGVFAQGIYYSRNMLDSLLEGVQKEARALPREIQYRPQMSLHGHLPHQQH